MEAAIMIVDRTGQQVGGEMPRGRATPTWRYNATGTLTISTPADDTALDQALMAQREIQLWLESQCVMWTVPATARAEGSASATLDCFEAHGLLAERRLRADVAYANVDEAAIISDLVTRAQTAGAGGSLAIGLDAPNTGVLRDRTYAADERHPFLELIDAISKVRNGPDYWLKTTADGKQRNLAVRAGGARGAFHEEWAIESGAGTLGNVVAKSWSWQRPSANDVEMTAGEGKTKLVGRYKDDALIAAWGGIQDVAAAPEGTTKMTTLLRKAEAEVDARGRPMVLVGVTINGPREMLLAAHELPGSTIPVKLLDTPRPVDATYRINAATLDPYTERLQLEVEETG